MPLVNVKLIEGVFNESQKRDMIRRLTDTMVEIEGEALRSVTWVVVEEVQEWDGELPGIPHDGRRQSTRCRATCATCPDNAAVSG